MKMNEEILYQYTNGNSLVTIKTNGTREIETQDDDFAFHYPLNIDLKVTNKCLVGNCAFCHEASSPTGLEAPFKNFEFLKSWKTNGEVALGGGQLTSYDKLDELLQLIKDCKLIANATFHDKEILNDFDRIKKYQEDGLLHGIGVSLHNPSDKLAEYINSLDNVVIHIINGIFTENHLNWIKENIKKPKLLILAYKHFRKGNDYYDVMNKTVDKNQKWLYDRLPRLIHEMYVVSFDNAAIEQLDVKRLLTDKEFEEFYQGDETVGSFYVDAVNGLFAPNSTHTSREPIMDDIHDMFMRAKELYKNSIR